MSRVFISYAHAPPDDGVSQWLAQWFTESGHMVWRDDQLRHDQGGALNAEIATAIEQSDNVIALLSSAYLTSGYCRAELIRAMELSKPILRVQLEPIERAIVAGDLLPLLGEAGAVCTLDLANKGNWPRQVSEAASHLGVRLSDARVESMDFGAEAAIIRPPYRQLKTASQDDWRRIERRLVEAQALSPANGYTALSLSLLRLHLGQYGDALHDIATARRHLPRVADVYHADALIQITERPVQKYALAEVTRTLDLLRQGRALPGAGQHLWLLAGLISQEYFAARYIDPPEPIAGLLAEGVSDAPKQLDEVMRVVDIYDRQGRFDALPGLHETIVQPFTAG